MLCRPMYVGWAFTYYINKMGELLGVGFVCWDDYLISCAQFG